MEPAELVSTTCPPVICQAQLCETTSACEICVSKLLPNRLVPHSEMPDMLPSVCKPVSVITMPPLYEKERCRAIFQERFAPLSKVMDISLLVIEWTMGVVLLAFRLRRLPPLTLV